MNLEAALGLFGIGIILAMIVLYYVDAFLTESRKKTSLMREQNYYLNHMGVTLRCLEHNGDANLAMQKEQMITAKKMSDLTESIYEMHSEKHSYWALKTFESKQQLMQKRLEDLRQQVSNLHQASPQQTEGPDEGAPLV